MSDEKELALVDAEVLTVEGKGGAEAAGKGNAHREQSEAAG